VTPLVKHKIVKKRTAPFRRYQSDRKVTVKVRARAGSRALPLRVSVIRALTIATCAARVERHDARRSGPAVGVACRVRRVPGARRAIRRGVASVRVPTERAAFFPCARPDLALPFSPRTNRSPGESPAVSTAVTAVSSRAFPPTPTWVTARTRRPATFSPTVS
jgi:hypothetical protein